MAPYNNRWIRWMPPALAGALGVYAGIAAAAWWRYGTARPAQGPAADSLLDRFMPVFDVAERHHVAVDAPAPITLQSATEMDLQRSRITRAIFRTRELVLGARQQHE